MNRPLTVDLFVEDRAHEELLRPLVERVAAEEEVAVSVRVWTARGGHPRALHEFGLYQRLMELERDADRGSGPNVVVVGIDGNCTTFARKREEIRRETKQALSDRVVAACPDPHVERWYLADPDSFIGVVGHRPAIGRKKCARDHYKALLADAVRAAGHPPTLGGIEFAREIALALDLYRAGKNDRSFKAFVDDLRGKFQRLRGTAKGSRG